MKGGLSVVIPNYNHGAFIAEALEAVLGQSLRAREVIVVDDASTDASVEIVSAFARKDATVKLLRNPANMGMAASTNRGLTAASGDYVYLAAADDKALPGLFQKSIALLEAHPAAGLCCADTRALDEASGRAGEQRQRLSDAPVFLDPEAFLRIVKRRFYPPIAPQSVIYRRSALELAGGYRPQLRWAGDWFCFTTIGFRHGICHIPEPLAVFRVLAESTSAAGHRSGHDQITAAALTLLETSEFEDVRPMYQATSALTCCPARVLGTLLRRREGRRYLSAPLLLHALWDLSRRACAPLAPESLKRRYRRLVYGRD